MFDQESEDDVRGFYDENHEHEQREHAILLGLLLAEAMAQTAAERWHREQRPMSSRREAEAARWHAPRVERSAPETFRIVLRRGDLADPKKYEMGVVVTLATRGPLSCVWFGVPEGTRRPNLLLRSASNLDQLRMLAKETMRTIIDYIGRFDPKGQAAVDEDLSL